MPLHLLDMYLNCVQGLAEELALRCWCRHVGRSTILLAESRCHLLRAHGTTYVIPATTIPVVLVRMDSGNRCPSFFAGMDSQVNRRAKISTQ